MQNSRRSDIAARKIADLFKPGSRGIKKAMGKDGAQAAMKGLISDHPDTAVFALASSHREAATTEILEWCRVHAADAVTRVHAGWVWVTVKEHVQLHSLLEMSEGRWRVHTISLLTHMFPLCLL